MKKNNQDGSAHNILFLMKRFATGGIGIKTTVLANEFLRNGHSVTFTSFFPPEESMLKRLDSGIEFYSLGRYRCSWSNVKKLRSILITHRVNIVINQWGLPFIPLLTLKMAAIGLKVKIVSAYYNDPAKNNRIALIDNKMKYTRGILRWLMKIQRTIVRAVTGLSMHYNYSHSDRYVLLSDSFVPRIKEFAFLKRTDKIAVIPNPLTLRSFGYIYEADKKYKEILFVGRLENIQKRVDRVLDVWALCWEKHPDWKLTIVGDGPHRKMLEEKAGQEGIRHIAFEGKQDPTPYYKRASILLLTSEYEGFGIVLTECMSFGVVPIVYGSFCSVYDIINHGKDGLIVPYDKNGFDARKMADMLMEVINDKKILDKMGKEVMEASKRFSIDKIYPMWRELFDTI